MWYLIGKIFILLLLAFLLGLFVGWLWWSRRRVADAPPEAESEPPTPVGLENDEPVEAVEAVEAVEPEPSIPIAGAPRADPEEIVDSVDDSVFLAASRRPIADLSEPEQRDDLKLIWGVGPKLERLLHDYGVTTFEQIAQMSASEIADLQSHLSEFPGRIERDDWQGQASKLHAEHHDT